MTDLLDELDQPKTQPSDRTTTADLMARLERHYIKPAQDLPGGAFVPEVGVNGTWGAAGRCDAIYVGFTSTSGRLLVGHEVKASRADWLHELDQPHKATQWADQCHEWWLVTIPGVVRDGELPAGWGLMVPGTSKTRMKIVTPAQRHLDRQPSWNAVRSIIARQDTLRAQAIRAGVTKGLDKIRADHEAMIEQRVQSAMYGRPDAAALENRLERIERALGGHIVEGDDRVFYMRGEAGTEQDLADVAALLATHRDLHEASQALVSRYGGHPIRQLRDAVDKLEQAHARALAAIGGAA